MARHGLSGIDVFLSVAEHGSLRAASRALGVQPPAVSQQLKALEEELGTMLFARTTRALHLTDAGRALLQRAGPAFTELQAAMADARNLAGRHRGVLRITMPWVAYRLIVATGLAEFQAAWPDIELELSMNEAFVDIVAEGFHAGIRMGDRIHPDMIALRLTAPLEEVCFAAPSYIARRGKPMRLADLTAHNCIRYRFQGSGQLQPWRFDSRQGAIEVAVGGNLIVNSFTAVVEAARDGVGIGKFFRDDVAGDMEQGTLKPVLAGQTYRYPGFHLFYPRHNARLPLLRAFIDFLKERAD